MNEKNSDPLNAAQIEAVRKQMQMSQTAILRDIDLRKYALVEACKIAALRQGCNPMELAEAMHAFLVGGAKQP